MQKGMSMTLKELMNEIKEWSEDADKTFLPLKFRQGEEQITLKASAKSYVREPKIVKVFEIYKKLQAIETYAWLRLKVLHVTQGMGTKNALTIFFRNVIP